MTAARKRLGTADTTAGGAATDITAYTVPALTDAVVSNIYVCNRTGAATTFRVAVTSGGAVAVADYIAFDAPIGANETVDIGGLAIGAAYKIIVRAAVVGVTFSAFGQENS